ncbi:four-carbon acid sugar kinase family protein [Acidovorax kalamii]|uniref:four-carbon acid sugar kinase family protein n=1 Tax=Acidovorax kalamii TaxID=2004485 RepID=UPI0020918F70|nr:four-carbon acid sugar kinase family protein [Acidovorax kalamii]MCO5354345.1 hypothetical protein [Acidovorax kalamii]
MIAILADDLTSALDGAAPFAACGRSARVLLHPNALAGPHSSDVLAIDLDTRFVSPLRAQARFRHAAQALRHAPVLLKTIDSTLRGHLSAETCGALDGAGRQLALVAPAFPAAGRTTQQGRQWLHGMPLEQTVFASDPRTPITSSVVIARMGGPRGVPAQRLRIHDATTDADLDAVVATTGLRRPDLLWVGSPGLASALARAHGAPPCPAHPARHTSPPHLGRPRCTLVVVGSLHPANGGQVEELQRAGIPVVRLPPPPGEPGLAMAALQALQNVLAQALATHPVVCLTSATPPGHTPPPAHGFSAQPAQQLAWLAGQCAAQWDGLVATGGDTARRVIEVLQATHLDLLGEVAPGVPYGALQLPTRTLAFATKAGGFGQPDTLRRCIEQLHTLPTTEIPSP